MSRDASYVSDEEDYDDDGDNVYDEYRDDNPTNRDEHFQHAPAKVIRCNVALADKSHNGDSALEQMQRRFGGLFDDTSPLKKEETGARVPSHDQSLANGSSGFDRSSLPPSSVKTHNATHANRRDTLADARERRPSHPAQSLPTATNRRGGETPRSSKTWHAHKKEQDKEEEEDEQKGIADEGSSSPTSREDDNGTESESTLFSSDDDLSTNGIDNQHGSHAQWHNPANNPVNNNNEKAERADKRVNQAKGGAKHSENGNAQKADEDDGEEEEGDHDDGKDEDEEEGEKEGDGEEDEEEEEEEEDKESKCVQEFCSSWAKLHMQLEPIDSEIKRVRSMQAVLRANLAEYMYANNIRRAPIKLTTGQLLVVRLDPLGPTSTIDEKVIGQAVFEHWSLDLAERCAQALSDAASKTAAKEARERAAEARRNMKKRKDAGERCTEASPAPKRRSSKGRAKAASGVSQPQQDEQDEQDEQTQRTPSKSQDAHQNQPQARPTENDFQMALRDAHQSPLHNARLPTMADVMGEMMAMAVRNAQEHIGTKRDRLTVGIFHKVKDAQLLPSVILESQPLTSFPDSATAAHLPAEPSAESADVSRHQDAPPSKDTSAGGDKGTDGHDHDERADAVAFSAKMVPSRAVRVPIEVAEWAVRMEQADRYLKALSEHARPFRKAVEALTTEAPPAGKTVTANGRAISARRQAEMAERAARHAQHQVVRTAVSRYLEETLAVDTGMQIRFAGSNDVYMLRLRPRTIMGKITRAACRTLAGTTAAETLKSVHADPAQPYSREAMEALCRDDDFRRQLCEDFVKKVDSFRNQGTTTLNRVTLVPVKGDS